ncbi:hemoglobin [Limnobacter thiooxidans]|uniref:Group 1 truncated hemoglobin n=1 Tax=Limnobacter thiooxidans TaxID=131080 RepID=A0AA86J064_9BURK|nr:group 1 truncated hemoglobin [Limnobacter sp.]MCZ8014380.1 group 1 truncated hemoglobin [Limnobacter sp.]RZS41986.1 hemoglobin [Limnobacter thiooxidans]BET26583.1 group 1 truncated hemoglobin [Limnobacter thiooxidans]
MRKKFMGFALALGMVLSSGMAFANSGSLYDQLGGKESIRTVMDDFVARVKADPRIGDQFQNTDANRLASQLTDQVCEATGGPCKYVGLDMKAAHAGMTITKAHFNALVEVLVASMNAKGVPFDLQTDILALLAPMHRDVITVR